jgi:hypothetical protein
VTAAPDPYTRGGWTVTGPRWVRWWKPETDYPRNAGWTRWHMPGTAPGPLPCLPADRTVPQDAEYHDGQPPADQCCKRCLARAVRRASLSTVRAGR